MRSIALAAAIVLVAFLTGCVTAPADIPPTYVDQRAYTDYSCSELLQLRDDGEAALAELSDKQTKARWRSIAYNWVLVIGAGALTKDRSEVLGRTKGELLAIKSAITQKDCYNAGS